MKNSKLDVVAWAVISWLGVVSGALAAGITIQGTVLDDDGEPVPGAVVELRPWTAQLEQDLRRITGSDEDEALASVRSDGRGKFELSAPAGGSYEVWVAAEGWLAMQYRLAHLFAGVELRPLELTPAEAVVLRVEDAAGKPLPGAQVRLTSRSGRGGGWHPVAVQARAGADGTVKLAARRAGTVLAAAPGFAPVAKGMDYGTPKLALKAGKARTIELRDAAGQTVAGALVRFRSWAGDWPLGVSGGDGRLVVHPPVDGEFEVAVETADGHHAVAVVTSPEPGAKDPLAIALEEPVTFTGRVTDASTAKPLAGARVWLETDPHRFADSDRDGVYSFAAPPGPGGRARLAAAAPGFLRQAVQLKPDEETVALQDVEMKAAVDLRGRVVDEDGRGISGASIRARRDGPEIFTRSRAGGGFRLPAIPGEGLSLTVSKADYLTEHVRLSETDDRTEVVEVILRRGLPGFGKVVDVGGSPIPGAEVGLAPEGDRTDPFQRLRRSSRRSSEVKAVADHEGRFELRNLTPGAFELWSRAPGYAEGSVRGFEIRPEDDAAFDFGTVVLEPGVALYGKAVDPDGRPLAGVGVHWIRWDAQSGAHGFSGSGEPAATSDAAGEFVIEDLAGGRKITLEGKLDGYTQGQVVGIDPGAGEPATLELRPQARIRGVVVDTDGEPVPKAQVTAIYEDTAAGGYGRGLECDSRGRFQHDVDASRKLVLTARAPGFGSTDVRLEVTPGQVIDDLRLVLEPGTVLEGRVLGPDGDPIPGAEIRGFQEPFSHRPFSRPSTDDDGRFRLEGYYPGALWLLVRTQGFAEVQRQIDLEPGINTVEIRFAAPREIHGRVIDEDWNPVAEAHVGATGSGRRGGARTEGDGSFVIKGLADGSYRLTAGKDGFAHTELDREIEIDGGPVFGVELQLSAGGTIAGRVVGLDVDRLPGVLVTVEPVGRFGGPEGTEVDAEGGFRVEHLRSGEWTVTATEETSNRSARGVAVLGPGNDEAFVELEFAAGLTLGGRVLVDGIPAAGVRVEVQGLDVLYESWVVTDYRGTFRLVDLRPGRYRVEARRDDLVQHLELELDTDREIEVELSTHAVGGRVVDAGTETALAGAVVTLQALGEDGGELPGRNAPRLVADSQGFFRFAGVAEGTYRLLAERRGYGTLEQPILVEEGVDLANLELRLERTEGLKLEVRKADGGFPPWAVAVALDGAGVPMTSQWLVVGHDGTAHLSSLPAGRWLLVIGAEGAGTARLPVDVPSDPVTVVLPSATRVDVKVPELTTTGELATLTVTDAADRPFLAVAVSHPARLQSEWTVRAGWASVEGLPPGRWRLAVTASDGRSWETSVTAPESGGHVLIELE